MPARTLLSTDMYLVNSGSLYVPELPMNPDGTTYGGPVNPDGTPSSIDPATGEAYKPPVPLNDDGTPYAG